MTSRPFRISCPTCEATVRPLVADGGSEVSPADTLLGRNVTCHACDTEFEVLFYSE